MADGISKYIGTCGGEQWSLFRNANNGAFISIVKLASKATLLSHFPEWRLSTSG